MDPLPEIEIDCPYCGEPVEVDVDIAETGTLVVDCSVCCRPIELRVTHGPDGQPQVEVVGE